MAVTLPGLSTLGIKFYYGVETVASTKPETFSQLERCNNISGLSLSTEIIDASALEDYVSKSVAGRQSAGDAWTVTFNYTEEVAAQLKAMIAAYKTAKESQLRTWFEVVIPGATNAFFVVAEPPQILPMPEFAQNGLLTVDLEFAIQEYIGDDVAVVPGE